MYITKVTYMLYGTNDVYRIFLMGRVGERKAALYLQGKYDVGRSIYKIECIYLEVRITRCIHTKFEGSTEYEYSEEIELFDSFGVKEFKLKFDDEKKDFDKSTNIW